MPFLISAAKDRPDVRELAEWIRLFLISAGTHSRNNQAKLLIVRHKSQVNTIKATAAVRLHALQACGVLWGNLPGPGVQPRTRRILFIISQ